MRTGAYAKGWNGMAVVGVLLVILGIGWYVARELSFDPLSAAAEVGWPFFVIIPGLVLVVSSFIPRPRDGIGLAIAGTIVTSVGLVLLYQNATAHWESWAYAWALVGPGAAGLGMLAYGLVFRQPDLVTVGARLLAIALGIFAAGYWYFETVFDTGTAPVDLGQWWPIAIVVLGLGTLAVGLVTRRHAATDLPANRGAEGG